MRGVCDMLPITIADLENNRILVMMRASAWLCLNFPQDSAQASGFEVNWN